MNQELEEKRQELQNALVEAQSANKAKTSFLNNMSHDIRTPINGIMGMLTILEKSGSDGERAKDCLNKINESSKLLLSLVNDVLDMAKLESDTVVFSDEFHQSGSGMSGNHGVTIFSGRRKRTSCYRST